MPSEPRVAPGGAAWVVMAAVLLGLAALLTAADAAGATTAPSGWTATGRVLAAGAVVDAPDGAPGDAPRAGLPRYWLGAGVSGHAATRVGRVELRSVLTFVAAPAGQGEPAVEKVSFGAALLNRRLIGGLGLGSLAGELWAQWNPPRGLEGLALLNGLVAAGQTAASAGAWYATTGHKPELTWPGSPDPAVAATDGFQRRGTSGVEAFVLRRLTRSLSYEARLGWQERAGPAIAPSEQARPFDSPHLGYAGRVGLRWQPAPALELRAAAGARWRPGIDPRGRPQVGAGIVLRSQGLPLRLQLELQGLAEPAALTSTDGQASGGAPAAYSPLAAAAALEVAWPSLSLSALAQYPAACLRGFGCAPEAGTGEPRRPDVAVALRWRTPGANPWVDLLWTQPGGSDTGSVGIAFRW